MNIKKSDFIQVSGELFNTIQLSGIFTDSKTFVDSVPLNDPKSILNKFNEEKENSSFNLKNFALENFKLPEEKEEKINLPENRSIQEHIKLLWDILKRKPAENKISYSTLINLPEPYIIPGGRFREIYYWDSYFTMHGLLADNEVETVENMINNFSSLIDKFGFIPNGNRVYYLTRSQPPFFSAMIDLVCRFKSDYNWGLQYLPQLEKEYYFWNTKFELLNSLSSEHLVEVSNNKFLNRYYDPEKLPREESYLEDFKSAAQLPQDEKGSLYKNIRAACESGWDFSSRWFYDKDSLKTCVANEIIPVDLNSLLYFSETFIAKLYPLKGSDKKADEFSELSRIRKKLINEFLWNDKESFYFDYNWKNKRQNYVYSLAACFPLYFNLANYEQAEKVKNKIKSEFLKSGGLITTLNYTGQQWDAPNGWAPLQWIAIKGLRNYGFNETANEIKTRWLTLNENVFKRTGKMFEKYDVVDTSLHAGGGEYPLQDGFGWTNGVTGFLMSELDGKL